MKRQLLFPFFKDGLAQGEAVNFVTHQETPDQILAEMKEFGIDVSCFTGSGALHVYPQEVLYYPDGHFDRERTNRVLMQWYEDAMKKGFSSVRQCGEMTPFFEHRDLPEMIAYEQALHTKLELPVRGICAFDVSIVPVPIFRDLIAAHGDSFFLGPEIQVVA